MMTMVISGSDGVTFPDSTNQFSGGAFSFKNRIINGDMRIDQRNAGAAVTDVSYRYMLDRFASGYFGASATGRTTVQQSTTAPTGFTNSMAVTVTTADTTLAGSAAYMLAVQYIEGFNIADLLWGSANAKTVTVSFWVRSSVTGNFPFLISNGDNTRGYGALYNIASADTWEYKTIIVPGDTSGTWTTNNSSGLELQFGGGGESSNRTQLTGWNTKTGAKTTVTGATQLIETNGATWYVTGVQLEVGSVATPFERRPYGTELALCQRYYYKLQASATANSLGVGFNDSTTAALVINTFPVSMRTNPTALEQTGTAGDYSIRYSGANVANCSSVPTFVNATVSTAATNLTVSSGLTAGQGMFARAVNTNAYLAWSAEL